MRSVRCDVCGTKALTAASQCPKCSHLFEVRDGFGELLPLVYCSTCDSYYPESLGVCKWCGTKPEPAPIAPRIWKGAGIAALVVVLVAAWLMRDSRPKTRADTRTAAVVTSDTAPVPADTVPSAPTLAPVETVASRVTTASAGSIDRDNVRSPNAASVAPADLVVPQAAPRSVAASKPLDAPTVRPPAPAQSKSRTASRWVNSVAKTWVIVRADASKDSRIIASIGPASRVQLGESRGGWRRIKARGIAGWVESRSSFAAARTSPKAGGLASR